MLAPSFRYNAGIIRANGVPFPVASGASSAQLVDRHGNPISSGKLKRVDAIHRTDWQGRQLLYPTARTNILIHSSDISAAAWAVNGVTKSSVNPLAPSGTSQRVTTTGTASLSVFQNVAGGLTGSNQCASAIIEIGSTDTATIPRVAIYNVNTGAIAYTNTILSSNAYSLAGSAISGGLINIKDIGPNGGPVYKIWVSGNLGTAGQQARILIYPSPGVSGASLVVHCAQTEDGLVPSSVILTDGSALTVTDYTLSGSTVDFGETPLAGAVCDWTGVAKR